MRQSKWISVGSVATVCLLIVGYYALYRMTADRELEHKSNEATHELAKAGDIVVFPVQMLIAYIRSLASSIRRAAVVDGSCRHSDTKPMIDDILMHLSQDTDEPFLQMRYITAVGLEFGRVNMAGARDTATLVPPEGLQNKSGRFYFSESMRLTSREVYVSPLDLNIEHGVIEVPHVPVMRGGAVVSAPDGEICGVAIINLRAEAILTGINVSTESDGIYLLNSEGFYLSGRASGWQEDR